MDLLIFLQAMIARGYRGNPTTHKIYFLAKFSLKIQDYLAIVALAVLIGMGLVSEAILCW